MKCSTAHCCVFSRLSLSQLRLGSHPGSHPPSLVLVPFPCVLFPQLVFGTIISLANATLLLKLQPYVSNSDDTVSTLASWVTFFQVLRHQSA